MPPYKMPPTPVLQTQRLVLRPVRTKDAPIIQWRFPKWEVVRWLDARVPWPYPADGAATFVATCLEEMARGQSAHWAIVPKSGPADLIGLVSLWPDDGESCNQRGFWLDPAFQGRGLMTEAADRVTDFALRELGWPHLWLTNAQANQASRRIKEKQGARLIELMIGRYVEGPGPQMVWQLMREDWLDRRSPSAGKETGKDTAKEKGRRLSTTALDGMVAGG
jgi:[ribosomal protein S5]-alanine N-acetyltransferase